MTKLTTLFAIITLSTTLGLAGCKGKRSEEAKDNPPAEKANEAKPDDKAAPKPDEPKKDEAKKDWTKANFALSRNRDIDWKMLERGRRAMGAPALDSY